MKVSLRREAEIKQQKGLFEREMYKHVEDLLDKEPLEIDVSTNCLYSAQTVSRYPITFCICSIVPGGV